MHHIQHHCIGCRRFGTIGLHGSVLHVRREHGAAAIDNTTIAVLGGIVPTDNSTETTDVLQLYDIASDTWRTGASAPYKVNHPNVASVDGKLYLLDGLTEGPTSASLYMNWIASKSCHVYDPVANAWDELADIPSGTKRGSAVMGVNGEVIYLAGGMTVLMTGYQDAGDSRLPMGAAELPESRQHAAGSVVGDSFYVIGGRRYGQLNFRDTVFELDLTHSTAEWSTSTGPMPTSRGGINGGAIGNKYYIFGGEGNVDSATGTDMLDLKSQEWTELQPMAVPWHGTQAVALGDRVYIPGSGLQQDGKQVITNGTSTSQQPSAHFDAYCA
ncbi:hypothetical protein LQW54_002054 [Pestalotiopsis sp. IQ-011]